MEGSVEQASIDPEAIDRTGELTNPGEQSRPDQGQADLEEAEVNKIKELPKELGVMLLTAGIVGFHLAGTRDPGHYSRRIGRFRPEAFGKIESWLEAALILKCTSRVCAADQPFPERPRKALSLLEPGLEKNALVLDLITKERTSFG